MGGGVKSPQEDSTPNGVEGGVELSQDDSTRREVDGPRGDKTPGALTAPRYQRGEDGQGRGRGDENRPTTRSTRGQGPDNGDGAAQGGRTATANEAMEMAAGDGGADDSCEEEDDGEAGARKTGSGTGPGKQ